ncbi:MAG: rod shape-determining protein MreD [Pseudomonadota bacterium]
MVRNAPPWRLMNTAERRRYWWGHWRLFVPTGVTFALLFLMTAPLLVPVPVFPQLGLLAIFVWAMFQPGLMPPWAAFLIGIIADLLFAQPIGVNATLFAATAAFVRVFEARYGHHAHGFDWGVASIVVIVFELLTAQLMALAGRPIPLQPLAWQAVTSIIAYPLVVWLCALVQRRSFGAGFVR